MNHGGADPKPENNLPAQLLFSFLYHKFHIHNQDNQKDNTQAVGNLLGIQGLPPDAPAGLLEERQESA